MDTCHDRVVVFDLILNTKLSAYKFNVLGK